LDQSTGATNGNLSGHAWMNPRDSDARTGTVVTPSNSVGWVSFDRAETGNPHLMTLDNFTGSPLAHIDLDPTSPTKGQVVGWVKILSAKPSCSDE